MADDATSLLKIFPAEAAAESTTADVLLLPFDAEALCEAFAQATGFSVELVAECSSELADDGCVADFGQLKINGADTASRSPRRKACCKRTEAEQLLEQINDLIAAARWYEPTISPDELAATVPLASRSLGETKLSARLEAVVRGGAQALECQAAAMYLLDEATTLLQLRAQWGLAPRRSAASRELEFATADLEALVGHAVVLEDDALFELWNVPERQFAAAACVPIATPTTVLGTFWLYTSTPREFSDSETNLMEILAGRLAVELERELLLSQRRRPHLRT